MVLLTVVAGVSAVVLLSATTVQAQANEFRAWYADAWGANFQTAAETTQYIADARAGHLNAIVPQVRRRGDALYTSHYEPMCTDVASGYDPLDDLVRKAHDTNSGPYLEVHAWIVTYHVWQSNSTYHLPPQTNHPLNLHPDWMLKDNNGNTLIGKEFTFDPGHPEVQKHTFNVCMDIITNYDVDGLNFDYIRYSSTSEGYNDVTVARFNRLFNRSGPPSPSDTVWTQFRRDQVTGLLRKVYLNAIAVKPRVKISCDTITWSPGPANDAAWYSSSAAWNTVMQDWRGWMEEGILDLNLPMTYFDQAGAYTLAWTNWCNFARDHRFNRHAAINVGTYMNTLANAIVQVRFTRTASPGGNYAEGLCVYDYGTPAKSTSHETFINAVTNTTIYDPVTPPIFAQAVTPAPMPWKTSPAKGHLKGYVCGTNATDTLDGAVVRLSGGAARAQTNDATGFYGFVDLPPGTYSVSASFAGYPSATNNVLITAGVVTSLDFVLSMTGPPVIKSQPQNLSVNLGSNATFMVSAVGAAPLGYQWQLYGTNLAGATASSYTCTNAQPANAGPYAVVVSNAVATIASSMATLSVQLPGGPGITNQPQSLDIIAGQNAGFSVLAGGWLPLSYQWRFNGAAISGATDSGYTRINAQPADAGPYVVVISNVYGAVTSAPAAMLAVSVTLTAGATAGGTVSRNPDQGSYTANSTVTLTAKPNAGYAFTGWSADASGTANPLSVVLTTNKVIVANFASTVTDIILDNTNGAVTFSASSDWSTGTMSTDKYATDYRYATAASGGTSTATYRLNIGRMGCYDVYIWYPQGSNRTTNAPWTVAYNGGGVTVPVDQTGNGGGWRLIASGKPFLAGTDGYVRVSNNCGAAGKVVLADGVRLTYSAAQDTPPGITNQPQEQGVNRGASATFNVTATGSPLNYQWQFNGTDISGATGSSYTRQSVQPPDAGSYSVVVSNAAGIAPSSAAMLTVNVPPSFNTQPQSRTNTYGSDATFTASVGGTGPLSFQWRFNASNIADATASDFTRTGVHSRDAGSYSVVVSNVAGSATSANAVLMVLAPAAPHIEGITSLAGGQIRLVVSGSPGQYSLDGATNLSDWIELTNLTTITNQFEYLDSPTNLTRRFYRARLDW